VDTNSEHNERQSNPDVNSKPHDVTAVSEPFDPADIQRRLTELEALLKPHQFDRWHPLRRASDLTGIPKGTLQYWIRTHRIARDTDCRKLRGMWFINPAWVASQAALNPRKDTA